MRDWLENLEEIDQDCVHQYEYLLGRQLTGYEEYHEIDSMVDEMILEFETRRDFFEAYPDLKGLAHVLQPGDYVTVDENQIFAGYLLEVDGAEGVVEVDNHTGHRITNFKCDDLIAVSENNILVQNSSNHMMDIWGRLGISLAVTPQEMAVLSGDDYGAAQELLIKLIQSDRCQMSGDTYFPYRDAALRPDNPKEDLDFDLPIKPLYPEQVYCLCEELEQDDGIREFRIMATSKDKELLREYMQTLIKSDAYGLVEDNGVNFNNDDHFCTNFENGFVEYYIREEKVLSRPELEKMISTEQTKTEPSQIKKMPLSDQIKTAESKADNSVPISDTKEKNER